MKKGISTKQKVGNVTKPVVKRRGIKPHFFDMKIDAEKKIRFLKSGHDWETDEDGTIDIFANGSDNHNAPRCKKCGYDECWHCNSNPPKCPCA